MTLVTQATIFAADVHDGALRKGTKKPYIVHPVEAMAIAAALTDDEHVLAAAVLHDVIEDCGVTAEEIERRFGARVAYLVLCETQKKEGDPRASWLQRKRETVRRLETACRDAQLIALCDKLSNMRAIERDYRMHGEALFDRFHQRDKRLHAWYYRRCTQLLRPGFGDTKVWQELCALVDDVFADVEQTGEDAADAL